MSGYYDFYNNTLNYNNLYPVNNAIGLYQNYGILNNSPRDYNIFNYNTFDKYKACYPCKRYDPCKCSDPCSLLNQYRNNRYNDRYVDRYNYRYDNYLFR